MSLIKKIEAEIAESEQYGCEAEYRAGLYKAIEIILSEQKNPEPICKINDTNCTGYKDGKCHSIENCYGKVEQPVITIGDKIRESNESLALELTRQESCYWCAGEQSKGYDCKNNCNAYRNNLNRLNQPYIPTQSPNGTE